MARILTGKEVSESLDLRTADRISALKERGVAPTLEIIRVGEDPGQLSYERGAVKRCEALGINVRIKVLQSAADQENQEIQNKLLDLIREANGDPSVHGVLLLRPLPPYMDRAKVENALLPEKDVDGMTDLSLSGVFTGRKIGYAPCTAEACLEILDYYKIPCAGKRAAVIGRSAVIGKPAAMLLLARNATVTVCHTKTEDLPDRVREADLVVASAGRAKLVGPAFLKPGQVILDVGINVDENGKLCGDVDFDAAEPVVEAITPVPRGVGSVTTSVLAAHTVEAAESEDSI